MLVLVLVMVFLQTHQFIRSSICFDVCMFTISLTRPLGRSVWALLPVLPRAPLLQVHRWDQEPPTNNIECNYSLELNETTLESPTSTTTIILRVNIAYVISITSTHSRRTLQSRVTLKNGKYGLHSSPTVATTTSVHLRIKKC